MPYNLTNQNDTHDEIALQIQPALQVKLKHQYVAHSLYAVILEYFTDLATVVSKSTLIDPILDEPIFVEKTKTIIDGFAKMLQNWLTDFEIAIPTKQLPQYRRATQRFIKMICHRYKKLLYQTVGFVHRHFTRYSVINEGWTKNLVNLTKTQLEIHELSSGVAISGTKKYATWVINTNKLIAKFDNHIKHL